MMKIRLEQKIQLMMVYKIFKFFLQKKWITIEKLLFNMEISKDHFCHIFCSVVFFLYFIRN